MAPNMKTNLEGRVRNLNIGTKHLLQALYEAVSNSLHAIHGQNRPGQIAITFERDTSQLKIDGSEGEPGPIVGISIKDNGEGFSARNFDSFLTLDSQAKAQLGGKGVGRLVWLKFFKEARVESTYKADKSFRTRRFVFRLPNGVENEEDGISRDADSPETTISLFGLNQNAARNFRHRVATIKNHVLNHFLSVFLTTPPPTITISDGDDAHSIGPSDLPEHTRTQITVNGQEFLVVHAQVRSPEDRSHRINYCASGRVVESERIRSLPESRLGADSSPFYCQVYVSSPYLDGKVNQERTAFDLDEEPNLVDAVSKSELRDAVVKETMSFLDPVLQELRKERDERLGKIIEQEFPEYKYLHELNGDDLAALPLDVSDEKIEDAVAQLHFRNQRTGRALLKDVVAEVQRKATFDPKEFVEKFDKEFAKASKISQASFLSYLIFRKSVIDIFEQLLRKAGDRFQREASVHELMFPMGKDLEPAKAFLEHNLWLIDERLTYASYIASDKALDQHRVLFNVNDKGEPDVVAYFNLGFSADSLDGPMHDVVIVEFKRPGPLPSRDEDPYDQVLRYIDKIRDGFYNHEGKKVKASETTRFYCYIVCDLDSDKVERLVRYRQFKAIFGGEEGYFLYNEALRAYVELVPFEKILRSAKRNHRAFFERAGLAPGILF